MSKNHVFGAGVDSCPSAVGPNLLINPLGNPLPSYNMPPRTPIISNPPSKRTKRVPKPRDIPQIPSDVLATPLYDIPGAVRPPERPETYAETEARITAVLEWVEMQDRKVNFSKLCRFHGLPYNRTLERYHGRPPKGQYKTNCWLSSEQDAALCWYLARLDQIGTSPTHRTIRNAVDAILAAEHTGEGPPPVVSSAWTGRWLREQHPEFLKTKQFAVEVDRKVAQSPEAIRAWLKKYRNICEEYGIFPEDIWNGDESGFRVGMGKDQVVYSLIRNLRPDLPSATCRELVTVIECVSAAGVVLPPMIILPGAVHLQAWYDNTGIDGDYLLATSETGYSHDEYGLAWVRHVDKFSQKHQKGKYRYATHLGFSLGAFF